MSDQGAPETSPITSAQEASDTTAMIEAVKADKGLDEATRQQIIQDAQARLDAWNQERSATEPEGKDEPEGHELPD